VPSGFVCGWPFTFHPLIGRAFTTPLALSRAKTLSNTSTSPLPRTDERHVLPKGKLNLPEGELNLPKGKLNLPKGKLNLPKGKLNLPKGKLNLPKGELNLPKGELNLPKGKLNLPTNKGTGHAARA
jgi:hypothetical protein